MSLFDEKSKISDLTNGEHSTLKYDSSNPDNNYSGPLVQTIVDQMAKAGLTQAASVGVLSAVGLPFQNLVMAYQEKFGFTKTGVLDDNLLHDIYTRGEQNSGNEITSDDDYEMYQDDDEESDIIVDPHYEPFFLNNSSKIHRKNRKDIIISLGNGQVKKTIKDVYMRSVSVQVDTSGNPISEVYNFIARDIKESDADEDSTKYIGETNEISASSDIKYSYDTLFKDQ